MEVLSANGKELLKSITSCLLVNRNERDQEKGGQTHPTYLFYSNVFQIAKEFCYHAHYITI